MLLSSLFSPSVIKSQCHNVAIPSSLRKLKNFHWTLPGRIDYCFTCHKDFTLWFRNKDWWEEALIRRFEQKRTHRINLKVSSAQFPLSLRVSLSWELQSYARIAKNVYLILSLIKRNFPRNYSRWCEKRSLNLLCKTVLWDFPFKNKSPKKLICKLSTRLKIHCKNLKTSHSRLTHKNKGEGKFLQLFSKVSRCRRPSPDDMQF